MRIHSVVSIAQLESALHKSDFYDCQLNVNSFSVKNEVSINDLITDDDVETAPVYEIEHLLNKWTQWIHGRFIIEYLVKWKKYNHSHNTWYEVKNLSGTKDLIKNYEKRTTDWAAFIA